MSNGGCDPTTEGFGGDGGVGPPGPEGPAGPAGPAGPGFTDGTGTGQIKFWDGATWQNTATPNDGDVFVFDSASGLVVPVTHQTGIVMFGAQQINTGTTFLFPGYADTGVSSATEAAAGQRTAIRDGRLRRMKVRHGVTSGGGDVIYTLMVNGIPTALTVTLSTASNGPASNLVAVVNVANDDRLSIQAEKASVGTAAVRCVVELEWVSP